MHAWAVGFLKIQCRAFLNPMFYIKSKNISNVLYEVKKHFIQMLEDVGMIVPKITETRCTIQAKAGDDGMKP